MAPAYPYSCTSPFFKLCFSFGTICFCSFFFVFFMFLDKLTVKIKQQWCEYVVISHSSFLRQQYKARFYFLKLWLAEYKKTKTSKYFPPLILFTLVQLPILHSKNNHQITQTIHKSRPRIPVVRHVALSAG